MLIIYSKYRRHILLNKRAIPHKSSKFNLNKARKANNASFCWMDLCCYGFIGRFSGKYNLSLHGYEITTKGHEKAGRLGK